MRVPAILLAVGSLGLLGLTGCYETYPGQGVTNDYHNYIPMTAESVGTGTGSLSYIANKPGTVYLIDWNRSVEIAKEHYAPKVIGNYFLLAGQGIAIDGSQQTVTVGATGMTGTPTVFHNPHLSTENSYELRFIDKNQMVTF